MISLTHRGKLRVLAVGAHADDVEIGAGATLLRFDEDLRDLVVQFLVLTSDSERAAEARESARAFLPTAQVEVQIHDLPDGHLPARWSAVKSILRAATGFKPDVVLSPSPDDAHQDHRTVGEIIPTEFRDHLILQYEIPKWDGDLGRARPTHYVPLEDRHMARKCQLLAQHFPSQGGHDWFQDETFRGLARIRGMECRAPYAEAFAIPKALLAFGE